MSLITGYRLIHVSQVTRVLAVFRHFSAFAASNPTDAAEVFTIVSNELFKYAKNLFIRVYIAFDYIISQIENENSVYILLEIKSNGTYYFEVEGNVFH